MSEIKKAGTESAPRLVRVIDYETTGLPDSPAAEVIELARIDVDLATGPLAMAGVPSRARGAPFHRT